MSVPIRTSGSDADKMVSQEPRPADSSPAVTGERSRALPTRCVAPNGLTLSPSPSFDKRTKPGNDGVRLSHATTESSGELPAAAPIVAA